MSDTINMMVAVKDVNSLAVFFESLELLPQTVGFAIAVEDKGRGGSTFTLVSNQLHLVLILKTVDEDDATAARALFHKLKVPVLRGSAERV